MDELFVLSVHYGEALRWKGVLHTCALHIYNYTESGNHTSGWWKRLRGYNKERLSFPMPLSKTAGYDN